MSRKKTKKSSKRRNSAATAVASALEVLSKVDSRLESLQTQQNELKTKIEQLPAQTIAADGVAQTLANTKESALDELVKTQQAEAAKRLREEVLPEARRAQRFYGYLTVSVDGGEFKMEKVESVSRLEQILAGVENGTIRVLMNPFAAQPSAKSFASAAVEKVTEVAAKAAETVAAKAEDKKGFFGRLFGG